MIRKFWNICTELSKYFDTVDGDIIHGMGMHDFYTTMQVLLQMSDRMVAFSV